MKDVISLSDEPPTSTVAREASFISDALLLEPSPSSQFMSLLTPFSNVISSDDAIAPDLLLEVVPNLPLIDNDPLIGWSKAIGRVSIGTPAYSASSVEFMPQWVMNPPTEGWHNTLS